MLVVFKTIYAHSAFSPVKHNDQLEQQYKNHIKKKLKHTLYKSY